MFRLQLQAAWNWLAIGWEASIEAQCSLVPTIADEGVNEEQIRLARRHKPSAVRRNIDADDWISQCGQCCLSSARAIRKSFTLAFFPIASKSRMSPLLLATANLPDSVVAAAEKSLLVAYCLNWLSTSLLPATRGSIRKRPLCAEASASVRKQSNCHLQWPIKVCPAVICAYLELLLAKAAAHSLTLARCWRLGPRLRLSTHPQPFRIPNPCA